MSFLSTFGAVRCVTLRVYSENRPAIFDAIVVFDRRHGCETQSFTGQATPFEVELPDVDATIVVRPRDATQRVAAEYEVAVAGKRRLWVRSWHGMPVLRRHRGGVIGAGLPVSQGPDTGTPPVSALAI
jgi:hypothetical protein